MNSAYVQAERLRVAILDKLFDGPGTTAWHEEIATIAFVAMRDALGAERNVLTELRSVQAAMTDDERRELWDQLQEGYCRHCGCDDPMCQCSNDE